jgi:DMSO/TMAO reductase YedYZ heme-binding membrane subunit
MTETKSTVEAVAETRDQMTNYLCVCGVKDVSIIVGAVTTGILAGYAAHQVLRGRWRSVPVVVSLALVGAAYLSKQRFVTKAALAVGGATLLLSNVHFTFWDQLEEDRKLEA